MSEQRTVDGRYRLDKAVGSGGMGVVWRAFDLRLGRVVAVKEVRFPSVMSDDERAALTKRALLEAQSAGRLDHPNIVPVHDVILENEQPFIIMRFVEGRSLDQTVSEDGPLPGRVVARIGVQLLDALGAAHAADVIHRDVKPHNVLIQTDGSAQLTDFSIASVFGTETLTKTGALLGSPGYIAPERLMTGATTPTGDLFALGATLFFAVEGVGPFTAKETIVGLFASATRPHPRPKFAGPRMTEVIDGLLEKNPDERLGRLQARAMLVSIAEAPEESETRSGEFVPPPPGRVDTDDRVRRAPVAAPGSPQGDLPSDDGTAVFAVRRAPEQLRPTGWQAGPSVPVSGAPVSGAPVSGPPVSGGTVYGRPVSGVPISGGPVANGRAPVSGVPVTGASGRSGSGGAAGGVVYGRPLTDDVPVFTGAQEVGWGPRSGGSGSAASESGASGYGSSGAGSAGSAGAGVSGAGSAGSGPGGSGVSGRGSSRGAPPPARPLSPPRPASPPAGRRWRRALAVVTIVVLGLGAGIIANIVATQNRYESANNTGTTVDDPAVGDGAVDEEPTQYSPPGSSEPSTSEAEKSPDEKSPESSSSSPGPDKSSVLPPPPPDGKVLSASLSVQQPPNQVNCATELSISITVNVKTSGAAAVEWVLSRGGVTVESAVKGVTEKDGGFSIPHTDVLDKPQAGVQTYTLTIKSPNPVNAGQQSIEINCAPADPGSTTPVPAAR